MTVRELYRYLDEKMPPALSCTWDNDGLMCCPDGAREVRRVLVTLDVTAAAVKHAIEGGYDVIVSHHPMIFKGLRAINDENYIADKAMTLIRAGVAVMSFHTRLDAVAGGVNDTLAALLGLCDVAPFGEEAIGRIGTLDKPEALSAFASRVKSTLGAPAVAVADAGKPVCRVAVLGGAGGDDVAAALTAGADTYVSGTLGYHDLVDAPENGMNLIAAGHYYTEAPVCDVLRAWIGEADETIICDIYRSANVAVI